jgi:GAF domain-containing protein
MARFGRSACMGAPIIYRDAPWGELFVSRNHGRDAFTDADLALARDLAQQIAFGAIRAEARG